MRATYECEQCFQEYDDESFFVCCNGDACNEQVCKNCSKKCKNPECKHWVCYNCLNNSSAEYCGEYCISCAMWSENKEGDWKNFDFVKKKMTHKQGLAFLKKYPNGIKKSKRSTRV